MSFATDFSTFSLRILRLENGRSDSDGSASYRTPTTTASNPQTVLHLSDAFQDGARATTHHQALP